MFSKCLHLHSPVFLPSQFLLHRVHHAVDQPKNEAAESLEEERTLGFDTIPWSDLSRTFWFWIVDDWCPSGVIQLGGLIVIWIISANPTFELHMWNFGNIPTPGGCFSPYGQLGYYLTGQPIQSSEKHIQLSPKNHLSTWGVQHRVVRRVRTSTTFIELDVYHDPL